MSLHNLPIDMANEIRELAKSYRLSDEQVRRYYLMGGRNHAIMLIEFKLATGAREEEVYMVSREIWNFENRELLSGLAKSHHLKANFKSRIIKVLNKLWRGVKLIWRYMLSKI